MKKLTTLQDNHDYQREREKLAGIQAQLSEAASEMLTEHQRVDVQQDAKQFLETGELPGAPVVLGPSPELKHRIDTLTLARKMQQAKFEEIRLQLSIEAAAPLAAKHRELFKNIMRAGEALLAAQVAEIEFRQAFWAAGFLDQALCGCRWQIALGGLDQRLKAFRNAAANFNITLD